MSESRKVTGVNYFCLGALFIFFGSVLLCALGFTVVLPFETTRQWPTVRCTIINASYDLNVCSCDEPINVFGTCVSTYPCLQVYVEYDFRSENGTTDQPWRGTSESASTDRTDVQSKQRDHQLEVKDLNRKKKEFSGTRSIPQTIDYSRFRFSTAGIYSTIRYGSITNMAGMKEERSDVTVVDEGHDVMNSTSNLAILHSDKKFASFPADMFSKELETSSDYSYFNAASESLLSLVAAADSRLTVAPSRAATTTRRGVSRGETAGLETRLNRVERDESSEETSNEDILRPKQVAMLYRSWDDSFHKECSLTECGDDTWNMKETRRFQNEWGKSGKTISCSFNPNRPEMVILEKTTLAVAVHAIFWPGLCLVCGISLWVGLCLGCWNNAGKISSKDDYKIV